MIFNQRLIVYTVSIAALLLSLLLITNGAAAQSPDGPHLGFHIAQGDALHIEAARTAGASFVVVVFSWADVDPERNHLYWEVPDAALRAAEFYGLEVVARVDRPPEWAFDETNPSPWKLDSYARFSQKVAARYGDRLAGIIIWNEPNLSLEWNGRPPVPEGYAQMLKPAYRAIKQVAPNLPVLAAGLAFTTASDETAMDDLAFLQGIYDYGGGDYFDILAAHPYGFGRPPDQLPAPDRLNFRRLELVREVMEANDDGHKPIWITEMGWRTAAPDPNDAWQVVTPRQQRDYTLQAIDYAADNYPWLERMAFWELNAQEDAYGYDLWHGPDDVSLAYRTLAANCKNYNPNCQTNPATPKTQNVKRNSPPLPSSPPPFFPSPLPILSPDVTIRLGDRGTLHPHWVHLHQGGERFSPDWQGEFFLTEQQADQDYDLLLETMQVDQPTNRLRLNGVELPNLRPRTRPDPTSTWVSQRLAVSGNLLQPGRNTLEIISGQRNPVWQYRFWRWENFQFRNIRLVEPEKRPTPLFAAWQPRPSPSGWSETNRLRPGLDGDFWLTGNRAGEIWRGVSKTKECKPWFAKNAEPPSDSPICDVTVLENEAANRSDLLFVDVLAMRSGQLAGTEQGLLWRASGQTDWHVVEDAPKTYSYVVRHNDDHFYAGFEEAGLWTAQKPAGPWQPTELPNNLTVLDIAFGEAPEHIYLATSDGVYVRLGRTETWQRLPGLPGDGQGEAGNPLKRFMTRLTVGQAGELVVRNLDQMWLYPSPENQRAAWQAFGPEELHQTNKLLGILDCCGPGALVGTNNSGLWQLSATGTWRRVDEGLSEEINITELLRARDKIYAGGIIALLESADHGASWRKVEGLSPVISDLLIDPAEPNRWIAATGAGLHRSQDGGQSWQVVSLPWTVYDLAFGPQGRLFVARAGGVAWSDNLDAPEISWQETDGLEDVLFFSVNPHPTNPDILLGGTWGNNLGRSDDGGQTIEPVHNGLETLSVLDVLWHPTEGQLTVGTIEGLFRSDDFGRTWFKLPGPLMQQTVHALWQTDDGLIWAGAADGLWFSRDYGVEWQRAEGLPVMTVLRLGQVVFEGNPWLWAGTEEAGLWLSNDNGATWRFGGLAGTSIYNLLVDPARSNTLIAATSQGILEKE